MVVLDNWNNVFTTVFSLIHVFRAGKPLISCITKNLLSPQTVIEYSVLRDGVVIRNDSTKYDLTSDRLLILNVSPEDAGQYIWKFVIKVFDSRMPPAEKQDQLYVVGEYNWYVSNHYSLLAWNHHSRFVMDTVPCLTHRRHVASDTLTIIGSGMACLLIVFIYICIYIYMCVCVTITQASNSVWYIYV